MPVIDLGDAPKLNHRCPFFEYKIIVTGKRGSGLIFLFANSAPKKERLSI